MIKVHRMALAVAASLAIVGQSSALDLPVKNVGGKQYYYYQVKNGETIYSLSKQFGISRDEIVEYNPAVSDGLKAGSVLYFPVSEFANKGVQPTDSNLLNSETVHEVKKGESLYGISHNYGVTPEQIIALNPDAEKGIKVGQKLIISRAVTVNADSDTTSAAEASDIQMPETDDLTLKPVPGGTMSPNDAKIIADAVSQKDATIVVALPFMLNEQTPSKQAQMYTDFYKGLMIAADTLSNREGAPIKILALDSSDENNTFAKLANNDAIKNASIIITPDCEGIPSDVANACRDNEVYLFNIFSIKDTTYRQNKFIMQGNIPHRLMYKKATEVLMDDFNGYTPLFITNKNGRNEKSEFTNYVREQYRAKGIDIAEITFENALHSSAFDALDATKRYVVIPASGSLTEFNKISGTLKSIRDNRLEFAEMEIFGYPDWLAFKGDSREMLHTLNATIYSRFFDDSTSFNSSTFMDTFRRWYGNAPMTVIPNQAILGFDVGCYLIKNFRANGGKYNPKYPTSYYGVQSSFDFSQLNGEDSGYVNDVLYIIKFLPEKIITSRVI
jgi:LysM repeat protein